MIELLMSGVIWNGVIKSIHISAPNQTKWWFAKCFLHPDIVAEYEYILLWDEDVGVEDFHPGRYISIVKDEGLEISQPALDLRKSEVHHPITVRRRKSRVHRKYYKFKGSGRCDGNSISPACVGWVEMMAPMFSRVAGRCAWYMLQKHEDADESLLHLHDDDESHLHLSDSSSEDGDSEDYTHHLHNHHHHRHGHESEDDTHQHHSKHHHGRESEDDTHQHHHKKHHNNHHGHVHKGKKGFVDDDVSHLHSEEQSSSDYHPRGGFS